MPFRLVELGPSISPILPVRKGILASRPTHPTINIGGSRLRARRSPWLRQLWRGAGDLLPVGSRGSAVPVPLPAYRCQYRAAVVAVRRPAHAGAREEPEGDPARRDGGGGPQHDGEHVDDEREHVSPSSPMLAGVRAATVSRSGIVSC